MKWTTPLVPFVAPFRRAWTAVSYTVRAGFALGPKWTRARVVLFVVPFRDASAQAPHIRHSVFPPPALTARRGGPAGGGERGPLGAPSLPSTPAVRLHRRASVRDRISLSAWELAPRRLRNRPRFRNLFLSGAARAAVAQATNR